MVGSAGSWGLSSQFLSLIEYFSWDVPKSSKISPSLQLLSVCTKLNCLHDPRIYENYPDAETQQKNKPSHYVFASGPKTVLAKTHLTQEWPEIQRLCMSGQPTTVVSLKKLFTVEKISCHTETIDAAWSAVKDFIPNSLSSKSKDLLLYVKCWQWRYVNLRARLQQKTISTYFNAEAPALKRQKERACQHHPMKWLQNPHETRIWPNSRARISHNSAYRNVRFAMAIKLKRKLHFLKITLFLGAQFPVRRDVFAVEDMGISWYILKFYSLT